MIYIHLNNKGIVIKYIKKLKKCHFLAENKFITKINLIIDF